MQEKREYEDRWFEEKPSVIIIGRERKKEKEKK